MTMTDFQQTFCDVCGPDAIGRRDGRVRSFEILTCPHCRLIWTLPLRGHDQTDESQESGYWAEDVYLAHAESQKRRFQVQLDTFLRVARIDDPRGLKVFECGAGIGLFLDVCDERGMQAEGCDLSPPAAAYANRKRQRVRPTAMHGYPSASFDALFAFNLIEHLPHPMQFLEEATRMLAPGGCLVLETPIQESLFHRGAWLGSRLSERMSVYYGLSPGGHIYKFSTRTIRAVADRLGYRIIHRENIGSPFGELWDKMKVTRVDHKSLLRLAVPPLFLAAQMLGQGNRIYTILRKE
jgi:2-polyprenyl-3-methyl-5-hydroxy-6-metoxy-1,4-benzoquinol methylase